MEKIDKELQEYYDNYFELFSSVGWKQLEKEVIENISNVEKSTLGQRDTDVFLINSGYISALRYIVAYKDVVESSWDELNTPELDDEHL